MEAYDEGRPGDEPVVVRFSGELDASDPTWSDELQKAGTEARFVVVDLLHVLFIDSSVVRELVLLHRTVEQRDGWVRLAYTHHLIRRVIEICGLSEIFPQHTTVESAARGTQSRHPVEHRTGGHAGHRQDHGGALSALAPRNHDAADDERLDGSSSRRP